MKMVKIVSLVAALLVLSNCGGAGLYDKTYRASNNAVSGAVFLGPNEKPKLIRTAKLDEDVASFVEDNYVVVGVSSFNGPLEDADNAVKKAQELGVTHVLLSSSYGYEASKKAYKYEDNFEYRPYVKDMGGYYGVAYDKIADPIAIPYRKRVDVYIQQAVYMVKRP